MPPPAASLAPGAHPNGSPTTGGFEPLSRVPVLLPLPLDGAYDYRAPPGLDVAPGSFVAVPLGRRTLPGVVWDAESTEPGVAPDRLKPIGARLDVPPMAAAMRRFIDWVAGYTLTPPGQVLRMAMSVAAALEPPPPTIAYRRAAASDVRPTPARRRVFELLDDGRAMTAADLTAVASVSTAVLRALVTAGALESVALPESDGGRRPDPCHPGPALSADQQAAAAALVQAVQARSFATTLLAGVTGAGKTEVYFEAIAATLALGRQVLVLLPEIALSAQWLERFTRRFGAPPTVWHSGLTPQRRRLDWRRIARGAAPVVVGARSALFLPLADVGLIVVDEEHDASFKQEDGVIYHARDMAVVRGRFASAPVVLASATPSLETVVNAATGRYRRLDLPARHGGAALPEVAAIDLRREPPPRGRFICASVAAAVRQTLVDGEQAMLFLNRRGYAPLTLCRACGHRLQCPNCAAWLVEHRLLGHLLCHHCGHTAPSPRHCPACQAEGSLVACGPGVERLAEEATALFPDARLAIMASDLVVDGAGAERLVAAMAAREIDILIGTQMVAKGHHFPHLTLVGVIDADLGLGGGDLRAGERTYQLLHQVAGRAGRAERPGRVLLQTVDPGHPVLRALVEASGEAFMAAEAEERRRHAMPPFGRLAALIVSSIEAEAADRVARALARAAPHGPGIAVLGPAPAPLSLLRGRHRRRLLLKTERQIAVQPLLRAWLAAVPCPAAVRVAVDVDPYTFL